MGDASNKQVSTTPDTGRAGPVPRDTTTHPPRSTSSIRALRAAYRDGAYDSVVQRVRDRHRDSLRTSESKELHLLLGKAEQARGRHRTALDALRSARRAAEDDGQSTVAIDRALGESYAVLYQWSDAASAFRRVLETRPDDRSARRALAEVYRRSQNWEKARKEYSNLVRMDSSNGRWWARLGQSNLNLDRRQQARRSFARAHRQVPQSAEVALSLSQLHSAEGDLRAAQRVVDSTLSHQPADPRLWRRRADLAFQQEDFERARQFYLQTLATGDSSATVFRRVGLIDVRRQQYAQALPCLQQSLRRDSSHTRTTLYLGVVHLRLDSLQRATTYLQKTVEQEASGPITKALEHLGAVHNQRGDVSGAVRSYKTAVRLRPRRTELYFRLATVYDEHYEDKAPAARYYRRFLQATEEPLPELRQYAESRLEALQPVLHMQEARRPTGQ